MQMVERPWGVAAYGVGSVRAAPDWARIRFKVSHRDPNAGKAYRIAGEAARRARTTMREHDVPDSAVDSSRLSLRTLYGYSNGTQTFQGYECQAAYAAGVSNLDGVQPLLLDLVSAGVNEIDGVDFDVAAKPELRAEARRKAVAAARAKAELYADAAGVRLGVVLHIDDVDPEQVGFERYRGHGSYSEQPSEQDLAPGHVVVSAAVVVGYALAV